MSYTYSLDEIKALPNEPGIYKYFDSKKTILYIGKAKNLNKRVRSYFTKKHDDEYKTKVLVSKIVSIEIIVTKSEKEALILENLLIKSEKPRYNIALKDDKTYPYIKITVHEPFPKIQVSRVRKKDGAKYFGPYPSIGSTRKLKQLLYDCFPIRDCKQAITLTEKQRKCILLDIGKCIGPCIYKDIKEDYDLLVHDLILFLSGKNKALSESLTKKMKAASQAKRYEKAALYRDQLATVQQLTERQHIHFESDDHIQFWVLVKEYDLSYVLVQDIIKGKLLFQKGFYQQSTQLNDQQFLEQCVLSYFDEKKVLPDAICAEKALQAPLKSICKPLSKVIVVQQPQRGAKLTALTSAGRNANLAIQHIKSKENKENQRLQSLKADLNLRQVPLTIMAFDISHLQGTNIVASSVCFKNGFPAKSEYRKYLIQSVSLKSNDTASMKEVVYRRLKECKQKKALPDLLVIDGGRGQLNFAYSALVRLELEQSIEIVSLAKKEEELYRLDEKTPITLARSHPGLQLLQQLRDESHRFALSFQRLVRNKKALSSVLNTVPGLSDKRIQALYAQYDSVESMLTAPVDDIAKRTSIPRKTIQLMQEMLL